MYLVDLINVVYTKDAKNHFYQSFGLCTNYHEGTLRRVLKLGYLELLTL